MTSLNCLELRLHLGDLIVHHLFGRPKLVFISGIGSKLTGLGQLLAQGLDLRCISAEGSGVFESFAALFKIAQAG